MSLRAPMEGVSWVLLVDNGREAVAYVAGLVGGGVKVRHFVDGGFYDESILPGPSGKYPPILPATRRVLKLFLRNYDVR